MSESSESSEELDVDQVEDCGNLDPEEIEADDVESEDSDDNDSDGAENDDEETGDPLDEEGDLAAEYLEELLDLAGLAGAIGTYVESGRAHVSIVTDSQTLVGKDGKVLEALQELSRLAVMTEVGHRSRLMLDIAGDRESRRKALVVLAHEPVQAVIERGAAARGGAMNPFERKIVHDAVAAAGLVSESEGVEPKRHVVITQEQ